jgi:hypothetical protein
MKNTMPSSLVSPWMNGKLKMCPKQIQKTWVDIINFRKRNKKDTEML